ncbi:hypothetical protein BDR06DRAFT_334612 [Suillus hirtellus]|nr:hypothetical protein BDR06DRAFT_334612 [Suillus hirtellus]
MVGVAKCYRELLVNIVSHQTNSTSDKHDKLTGMAFRLNRRLFLRETWRASRGDAQSHSNSAINTLVFRAETRRSQAYISGNSKHLNVEGFQEPERGIDQEHGRISKPTVVHIRV